MKPSFAAALVICLTLLLFTSSVIATITTSPNGFGCNKKCELRCSRSGRRDRCLQYCGICCGKCRGGCVPSGPYAHKAQCPCYRDINNTNKCP